MPSRSVRRRQHKQLNRLRGADDGQRRIISVSHLKGWRDEANRRAASLGAPAVWALEASERAKALCIDPSGELAAELSRLCAEAVARAAGSDLLNRRQGRKDRAQPVSRG